LAWGPPHPHRGIFADHFADIGKMTPSAAPTGLKSRTKETIGRDKTSQNSALRTAKTANLAQKRQF
jgi:hypothetical protein